tara:strand:+ start:9535 stop:9738 length:204 start_codon:yes stop_codon:yes gene_type:complete
MNKIKTQEKLQAQEIIFFLTLYTLYGLMLFNIYFFAKQETDIAIAGAPENKKAEVMALRFRLYTHFM